MYAFILKSVEIVYEVTIIDAYKIFAAFMMLEKTTYSRYVSKYLIQR